MSQLSGRDVTVSEVVSYPADISLLFAMLRRVIRREDSFSAWKMPRRDQAIRNRGDVIIKLADREKKHIRSNGTYGKMSTILYSRVCNYKK